MSELPASPPPSDRPAAGPGKGWRVALILSLGVNLLVVGAIAGAVYGEWRGHGRPVVRDLGFGPYGEALTPADRADLRRAFARETGGFRAERHAAREIFGRLLEVLRTEPFDAAALRALMVQQQEHMAQRLALGQSLLMQRISAMTPKERAGFADRLQAALARHAARHDRREPPPTPAPQKDGAAAPAGGSAPAMQQGAAPAAAPGAGSGVPAQPAPAGSAPDQSSPDQSSLGQSAPMQSAPAQPAPKP